MKCISGKKAYETEELAKEALIGNHILNHYTDNQGPINIYACEDCGMWHFTSKGKRNELLEDPLTKERIKREREANFWERNMRRR